MILKIDFILQVLDVTVIQKFYKIIYNPLNLNL